MENKINFAGLAKHLLNQVRELLPEWLPGGQMSGNEYVCADLRGGHGRSCSVNIYTGKWADFSSTEKGGDLISLYAAIEGITNMGTAASQLSDRYGFTRLLPAVINSGSRPNMYHFKHGNPTSTWEYKSLNGETLSYVARYDTPDGKQFVPWTWATDRWVMKAPATPRPLYGQEYLKDRPKAPLLIVEGEKAADAARVLLGDHYVVISWPNGAKAFEKADWTPIYGRKVLIWPDADTPGITAGYGIATMLMQHCSELKILNPDGSMPKGFDAADALRDGWDRDYLIKWAKSCVINYSEQNAKPVSPSPTTTIINNTQNNLQLNYNISDESSVPSESLIAIWSRLGLALTSSGYPICNEDNVARIFESTPELAGRLWFDDFYNSVFINDPKDGPRELKELDTYKLTLHLQRVYGLSRISDATVRRTLVILADTIHRNEPRDWMESLVWDGRPRIDDFFVTHLGAKSSAYTHAASKNFWLSMVARIYKPGCLMRTMVILKSKQWQGKSTAFAIIGGKWYAEVQENIQSNNFLQSLHGKMILEFADMSGMDRADVNRIKQIISCRMDRFRAPYDRLPADHPRQCVLVSTTNEGNFLRDDTGGSRFWPVETGEINQNLITVDRDQLFAESVARFKQNEDWYIMPTEETLDMQEEYRQEDVWENTIHEYFENNMHFSDDFSIQEIAKNCLNISVDKLDKSTQMRIARNLSVLGFKRFAKRVGQSVFKRWKRPTPKTPIVTALDVETYD